MPLIPRARLDLSYSLAAEGDCEWAARLMAGSDPWVRFSRTVPECAAFLAPGEHSQLLIARERATRIGYLLAWPFEFAETAYLASIAIAPAHRGRGAGRAMVAHFERRYSPPARHAFLSVSAFNDRARGLYERIGYGVIARIPKFLRGRGDDLIMHKRLAY